MCGLTAIEDVEEVQVLYQQWRPVPTNVKIVPSIDPIASPGGAKEGVDALFDLIEAMKEAREYGASKFLTIKGRSGQEYCDQLPPRPCRYSICE